jgi:ribonuclease BN (tRNA processing enzyme)
VKLQFLGTGAAFTPITENFQSNMILQSPSGKYLLIDCGSDARHAMAALGYTYLDIDSVYISHFHADHAGGLEWLGFTRRFDDRSKARPNLYTHPTMVSRLWDHVLSGGLQSLEGEKGASLNDFYQLMSVEKDKFVWESIDFQMIQTIHVYNGPELLPSYGLFFTTPKTKIFLTTDTQFRPELYKTYFEQADLIFHDCDTGKHKSAVHAHCSDLATLPEAIKNKMWLYHYGSTKYFNPAEHGFCGYVVKGQEFDV